MTMAKEEWRGTATTTTITTEEEDCLVSLIRLSLDWLNCSTPSCHRRGTDGDRDPRKKTFCIQIGSDENRFDVSLAPPPPPPPLWLTVTRQCPQTTTFEERGEPKRNRTEALLLTSLKPYRQAKAAHGTKQSGRENLHAVFAVTSAAALV